MTREVQVCFVGFTNDEVDNIMVYVYKKDNLFDNLIDSEMLTEQREGNTDTMTMMYALNDTNDYRVKLLDINTVYSITGLTLGNHYTEKIQTGLVDDLVKYGCINNNISYTLNGQQYGAPNVMSGVFNVVYINK